MKKQIIIGVMALALMAAMSASAGSEEWAIKADYTGSCSCNPACPCLFGSPPTLGHCDDVGLFEIKQGHYGDVSLDGISLVLTSRFGQWVKVSVSKDATDEQVKAAVKLITAVGFRPASAKVLSTEKVTISIERTADKIKFSVPSTTVEIEMMRGLNGKPIKIQNLPAPNLPFPRIIDHTQYKSITLSHDSEDKKYSYSGTNGFTAKIDATSKK
jgi:hypothetical protein